MDISTVSQENWLTNEELYLQQLENDVMWNSVCNNQHNSNRNRISVLHNCVVMYV